MSLQDSARSEAPQRRDGSTSPIPSSTPRDAPTNQISQQSESQPLSSSKRSNAAQLARSLASSSPWSDTFVPQTYGTISSRPVPAIAEAAARQESEDMYHVASRQVEQYPDPPPAYTRNPFPNSTPIMQEVPVGAGETQRSLTTDIERNPSIARTGPDVETPLIVRASATHGPRKRLKWARLRKLKRRKCWGIVCTTVLSSIIASVIVCLLVGHSVEGSSFFHRPVQPSQPWVPTSPSYERHETTADIRGAYKLYNKVELTTGTGSIDVEIEPQPCDAPAVLILSSVSGSVTLRITAEYLRRATEIRRVIHTEIRSFSGSIVAELVLGHGGSALVETQVGGQILSVLTSGVGLHDGISNLTTLSGTGTQKVVLTSLDSKHNYVSNIRGRHHSFASLDVVYPGSWLGTVHAASTIFGQVSVTGDDLTYTRHDPDNIVAFRGSGHNLTLTEVVSEGPGEASFKTTKREGSRSVL